MSAAVLRSGAEGKRGVESEQKPSLLGRGGTSGEGGLLHTYAGRRVWRMKQVPIGEVVISLIT